MAFMASLLREKGINVIVTREPGGTPLGEKLRALLLEKEMCAETEALLLFAARNEHIAQVISPALARGEWVISDRFTDASFAYQGGGRKLDTTKLQVLEQWVHAGFQPDLTLLFDVEPHVAARRRADRNVSGADKFEKEDIAFFDAVQRAYRQRASAYPARFRIIDGGRSIPAIQAQLRDILNELPADAGKRAP
jgi:dTMP kinase